MDIYQRSFATIPAKDIVLTICMLMCDPGEPTQRQMMLLARWIQGMLSADTTPKLADKAFGWVTYQKEYPIHMRRFIRGYVAAGWWRFAGNLPTLPSSPSYCHIFMQDWLDGGDGTKGGSM